MNRQHIWEELWVHRKEAHEWIKHLILAGVGATDAWRYHDTIARVMIL